MAENLYEPFFRERALPVVILRTSRFFPDCAALYAAWGWRLLPRIDRV
jgi:hypothetical protein